MALGRALGGIIADVMGLGKTLTSLASILHTLPLARSWASLGRVGDGKIRTRATLVLVPSSRT